MLESHLYHAYAWYKLYILYKIYNKYLEYKDLQHMASSRLLVAISITPYDHKPRTHHFELENEKERSSVMGNLLSLGI